ncbi:MAG: B12-binding domain-containing radical SAM protein [Deltaproteobacteria bacterium]|nr:B12-binding domain-containing radical SAM protein [Deltaproteobacteria bacterium]
MTKAAVMVPFDPSAPSNPSYATQPPLRLAYLAAVTRKLGYPVTVIDGVGLGYEQVWRYGNGFVVNGLTFDQIIERVPSDVDVIGVSMLFTQTYPPIRELIRRLKGEFPRSTVVMGGEGVSALAGFIVNDCAVDAVVVGEGESAWAQILGAVDAGNSLDDISSVVTARNFARPMPPRKTRAGLYASLDELPFPDWDDMPLEEYWSRREGAAANSDARYLPVSASRGCPFKCRFCTAPTTWGNQWYRSPENVVDELRYLVDRYGIRSVTFNDMSITTNIAWFTSFVERMAGSDLNLEWNVPTGIRAQKLGTDLLRKASASGLNYVQIAPETGSTKVMNWLSKHFSTEEVAQTAANAKAVGLPVGAYFIVGTPAETLDDYLLTLKFMRRLARMGVDEISVSVLVPHPGSRIFNDLLDRGRITFDDDFFLGLSQADFSQQRSYTEHFTGKQIRFLRLFALTWFYAWAFFHHPRKLGRLLRNIVTDDPNTKLVRVFRHRLGAVLWGFAPFFSFTSLQMVGRMAGRTIGKLVRGETWDPALTQS